MRELFRKYRTAIVVLVAAASVVAAGALGYVFGVTHSNSPRLDEADAQVRVVVEQYIEALNNNDLTKIKSLSVGDARDELTPGFNAGGRGVYPRDMIVSIGSRGKIHVVDLNILARGDQVYVAELYTEFADQKTKTYYDPGAHVSFSLFCLKGKWKVMNINKYMDYNIVPDE
ncbi:hypothetical protein [Mycobacteroides abscessus]|uniref:hypothetical protein n=1 Tax=Mycobacteroides abscessus TaxID=36809 RepID=UPI001F34ECA8|nr:hypothetical protein [Mycobacteroides abscessus]